MQEFGVPDIYFEENYAKLYEKIENGKAERIAVSNEHGCIVSNVIKRKIPIEADREYYDLVTPYGYGGPIITSLTGDKDKLIESFEQEMQKYVLENNIVSEFVRFHPIMKNHSDFGDIYKAEAIRKTLVTDLREDDYFTSQFGKSARKNIKQALNKGITYKVTRNPVSIGEFKNIYYSTMDRNDATEFYYFDDNYFDNILEYFKDNVLLVEAIYENKVIAAGFYFVYNEIIHIHLSGTLSEFLFLSPAYILRYAVAKWGAENGYNLIHHGGGRTDSEEDSLYVFKKNFAKKYHIDFYVGKKIWNEDAYNMLCNKTGKDKNSSFFPAYRSV